MNSVHCMNNLVETMIWIQNYKKSGHNDVRDKVCQQYDDENFVTNIAKPENMIYMNPSKDG